MNLESREAIEWCFYNSCKIVVNQTYNIRHHLGVMQLHYKFIRKMLSTQHHHHK